MPHKGQSAAFLRALRKKYHLGEFKKRRKHPAKKPAKKKKPTTAKRKKKPAKRRSSANLGISLGF